jgi:phosphate transport system protein
MTEIRAGFRQQLEKIEGTVIQLFAFTIEDLEVASQALLSADAGAVRTLAARETTVDSLFREVEELVNTQLVLQAPVASDLRLLLSVLRVAPELERSHDLILHIAEHAARVQRDDLSPRGRGLIQRMGETAGDIWSQASTAWYQRDPHAAERLSERDDDLDSLRAALMAELSAGDMALPVAMDMTLVGRYYERLGDHAVNVARLVVYLAGPQPVN